MLPDINLHVKRRSWTHQGGFGGLIGLYHIPGSGLVFTERTPANLFHGHTALVVTEKLSWFCRSCPECQTARSGFSYAVSILPWLLFPVKDWQDCCVSCRLTQGCVAWYYEAMEDQSFCGLSRSTFPTSPSGPSDWTGTMPTLTPLNPPGPNSPLTSQPPVSPRPSPAPPPQLSKPG
jgi:hypothetical protein